MGLFAEYRRARISKYMSQYGFDLLILSLPENIEYISGFRGESHYMINRTENYLILDPGMDEKIIVASAADAPPIVEFAEYSEAMLYGQFQFYIPSPIGLSARAKELLEHRYASPVQALREALSKMNPKDKRVGFDQSRTPVTTWREIEGAFPQTVFIPAAQLMSDVRRIKHPDEIALLERSCNIAEEAVYSSISKISLGSSEVDIASLCYEEMSRRNASPFFCVVTIDHRAAFCDTRNTRTQKVRDGSVIRFDIGCRYGGYHSDIARTAVYGKPNRRAEYIYSHMVEGQQEAIERMSHGAPVREAYLAAMKKAQEGIPQFKRHHVGHGIGIELYDPPFVNADTESLFEENEVYCIETPYYEFDWGGVQVEDTLVVGPGGPRFLSKSSRSLIRIGI